MLLFCVGQNRDRARHMVINMCYGGNFATFVSERLSDAHDKHERKFSHLLRTMTRNTIIVVVQSVTMDWNT